VPRPALRLDAAGPRARHRPHPRPRCRRRSVRTRGPIVTRTNVRMALVLSAATGITVALLFPYLLALQPQLAKTPPGLPLLLAAQLVQTAVLAFGASWLGLRLGRNLGLDAPWLRARFDRTPAPDRPRWAAASAIGLGTGAALVCADLFLFLPHQPAGMANLHIERWKGLLASFYGGIAEEVFTRLFLMTVVAWLLARLVRGDAVYAIAIVVSASLFAAGHLPAAAQIAPLDGWVVARVMTLNAGAGLAFGWIFWRWGLEHATVAHFSADLVLHVLA